MNVIKINEQISYIQATEKPLSSDVAIINDNGILWLYDVGSNNHIFDTLKEKYNIVISHFHQDHMAALDNANIDELYVSRETFKHCKKGNVVEGIINIGNIKNFPIASSHCKGCLVLQLNDKYAFVGDSIYSKVDENYYIYIITGRKPIDLQSMG